MHGMHPVNTFVPTVLTSNVPTGQGEHNPAKLKWFLSSHAIKHGATLAAHLEVILLGQHSGKESQLLFSQVSQLLLQQVVLFSLNFPLSQFVSDAAGAVYLNLPNLNLDPYKCRFVTGNRLENSTRPSVTCGIQNDHSVTNIMHIVVIVVVVLVVVLVHVPTLARIF